VTANAEKRRMELFNFPKVGMKDSFSSRFSCKKPSTIEHLIFLVYNCDNKKV